MNELVFYFTLITFGFCAHAWIISQHYCGGRKFPAALHVVLATVIGYTLLNYLFSEDWGSPRRNELDTLWWWSMKFWTVLVLEVLVRWMYMVSPFHCEQGAVGEDNAGC